MTDIVSREKDRAKQDRELVARGVLAPPLQRRSNAARPQPPGNIPDDVALRLWLEEREGR